MKSVHPSWQSTEDEQPVHVHARTTPKAGAQKISRVPAAVVGIALMLGVVVYVSGGMEEILGQLTPDPEPDMTVVLTQDGVLPSEITVQPGHIIRFLNNDDQPHILTSETLPTSDNEPFQTSNMFEGEDFFYTVPLGSPDGTHHYISEASEDIEGDITIGADPFAESSSESSIASAVFSEASSSSVAAALPTSTMSRASVPTVAGSVLAVNPYVVGGPNPRPTGSTSIKPMVTQHKPTKNTESGPTLWIAIACGAGALAYVTRKALKEA